MLENASGVALSSASGFTYSISDTFSNITSASTATEGSISRIAHDGAQSVTLSDASVADLISFQSQLAGSVYTLKDTLDNFSQAATGDYANIAALLGKAASIEIVDSPNGSTAQVIDGNVEANRVKLNTVVTRAVDGDDANKVQLQQLSKVLMHNY